MTKPQNEKNWEGTLDAFFEVVTDFRRAIPPQGLLTMSEKGRDSHVREFVYRWRELAERQPNPPAPFLTLLAEAQDGPGADDPLAVAYRECIAMLLDMTYEEKDEHDECKRVLEETGDELRECRRDMGAIKEGVASIAGSVGTIMDGLVELRSTLVVDDGAQVPAGGG